jgi:PAS domain S-box-containing protein
MAVVGHRFARAPQRVLAACGILVLLVLACPLPGASLRADEPPRRVLMLHAFNYTFPATTEVAEAARKRLLERSPRRVEIDADFLDLARITEPGHELRMAAFLRDKYARTPPDLVMTLGSAALPFVIQHRNTFAPKVPVVFTGISPQTYAALRPPSDVTGIITEFNLDKTLALAEQLQPDARRLYVIAGSGATDRRWHSVARTVIANRTRTFETTYLFELPYAQLVTELSRVPRDAIVILLTVFADGEGRTFIPAEVATALSAISPAPVYAPYDTYIGNGTVGGFVETFGSVGVAAADLALRVMAGEDPTTLPPRTNADQAYRVDLRALQRWGLRESDLPPGAVVLFKQPGIWDQHRSLVLAALAVFAVQTAFAAALLIQQRRRKRAELLLKESEERMTFAAASVNIALWQFDRKTNELWATEHCRAMFGLTSNVPLTRDTFLSAIHPEDRAIAMSSLQEASTAGRAAVSDVRVVWPDGQVRWVRIRTRWHSDERGAPHQLSGIFAEVTDQKAAETEAALQRQEVAHLMRVSVLGQLSGAIAHEVNQPLTAILSNAQAALHLLAQESPDLAEIRDALRDIVEEDNRAEQVIRRLRSLLKKGESRIESVDLNDLVSSTVALLHGELVARRINIEVRLAADLPATSGDSVQLQQVLLNLLMNAMDATASAGGATKPVTVSTWIAGGPAIELRVRDRGPGLALGQQELAFEPFYTTKEHGLGLGLSICSTIVNAHGGRLTLANDQGGGAVAIMSLPIREYQVAAQ